MSSKAKAKWFIVINTVSDKLELENFRSLPAVADYIKDTAIIEDLDEDEVKNCFEVYEVVRQVKMDIEKIRTVNVFLK